MIALIWADPNNINTSKRNANHNIQGLSILHLLRTNLKDLYGSRKRKPQDKIHVSDILSGSCLRKAFYARTVKDYD